MAVHGLDGGSLSAWTHESGHNWLVEFLPHYFEEVRVLAFGYRAREAYIASEETNITNRITIFAEELCNDLNDARDDQNRPLIFIGHGVGGIVIKSALAYAKGREALYGTLLSSTSHAVFFDTPHKGFDTNTWSAIAGDNVSDYAQDQFGAWSQALNDLSRMFASIGPHLHITSYLASVPLPGGAYVIPEASAILGYENEAMLRLDRVSHVSMCKYEDPSNGSFQRVKNRLKVYVGQILSPGVFSKTSSGKPRLASNGGRQSSSITCEDPASSIQTAAPKDLAGRVQWLPQQVHLSWAINPRFTGRKEELDLLHVLMSSRKNSHGQNARAIRVAVHGLGGVGKTQLVNQYAHQIVVDTKTSIFWLTADTSAGLKAQFDELAMSIRNESQMSPHVDKLLQRYAETSQNRMLVLEWMSLHEDFVLVLDNFDDITIDIQSYLPARGRGRILFTTRDRNVVGSSADYGLHLTRPTTSDSEALFLRLQDLSLSSTIDVNSHPEYDILVEIVYELDGFPLALSQAAAFIRSNGPMKLSEYLDLLKPRSLDREQLLRFKEANPEYPASIMTTWEISLSFLERTNPEAKMLLELLGFLSPFKIHESMLHAAVQSSAWSFGTFRGLRDLSQPQKEQLSFLKKGVSFRNAIGKLVSLSLIDRDPEGDGFTGPVLSVHPLVHEWIRTRLNSNPQERARLAWLAGLVIYQASDITSPEAPNFDATYMTRPGTQKCTIRSHTIEVMENILGNKTSSDVNMPLECGTVVLSILLGGFRRVRKLPVTAATRGIPTEAEQILTYARAPISDDIGSLQTALSYSLQQATALYDRNEGLAMEKILHSLNNSQFSGAETHPEVIFLTVYTFLLRELALRSLFLVQKRSEGRPTRRPTTSQSAERVLRKLFSLLALVPNDRSEIRYLQAMLSLTLTGFVSPENYSKNADHFLTDKLSLELFKNIPFNLTVQYLRKLVKYQKIGQSLINIRDLLDTMLLATDICSQSAQDAGDDAYIEMSSSRYISSSFGRYTEQSKGTEFQFASQMEFIWQELLPAADAAMKLCGEASPESDQTEFFAVFGRFYRLGERLKRMNAFQLGISMFASFKEVDFQLRLIKMFLASQAWASAIFSLQGYFGVAEVSSYFSKESVASWFGRRRNSLAPDIPLPPCSLLNESRYRGYEAHDSGDDNDELQSVEASENAGGFPSTTSPRASAADKIRERYESDFDNICLGFRAADREPHVHLSIWLQILEKLHALSGGTTTCTSARVLAWRAVIGIIQENSKKSRVLMVMESLALICELAEATENLRKTPLHFKGAPTFLENLQQEELEAWGINEERTKFDLPQVQEEEPEQFFFDEENPLQYDLANLEVKKYDTTGLEELLSDGKGLLTYGQNLTPEPSRPRNVPMLQRPQARRRLQKYKQDDDTERTSGSA